MAYLSPTIAAKRASSAASGAGDDLSSIGGACGTWSRSTREPIVDRLAETFGGYRHNRDRCRTQCVECTQVREQIGGSFDEIASCREVENFLRRLAACRNFFTEREQNLSG